MLPDLRYAWRQLAKSPGFACIAIITLAVGIGANTAIFSLVNGVLFKPLPFPEPDRIVALTEITPSGQHFGVSTQDFLDWKRDNSIFSSIAAASAGPVALTGGARPLQVNASRVSASYFEMLGARPELGRTFAPGEDEPGKDHVVVLSHKLWVTQFAGDPGILGRVIPLDGEAYTVIGVMPGGTYFDRARVQLYRPLAFRPQTISRDFHWLGVQGRLKRGVSLSEARVQMSTIMARLARDYPVTNKDWTVGMDPLVSVLTPPALRQALYTLLAAVVLMLLIACANLANLTLARGIGREREVAIRGSLGAGRWLLTRQFLCESILLSIAGCAAGLALGYAMLAGLKWAIPPGGFSSRFIPPSADLSMDARVLLFTVGISAFTCVLFGLIPTLQVSRPNLHGAIKDSSAGAGSGQSGRKLRSALVIAEFALAFMLLTGAGLLVRSLRQMLRADLGFDSTNVVTGGLPVSDHAYTDPNSLRAYLRKIESGLRAIPGVSTVALTSGLPLRGSNMWPDFEIVGEKSVDRAHRPVCILKSVGTDYFAALRIHLRRGRYLSKGDVAGASNVAVINAIMARQYFPSSDPIGRKLLFSDLAPGSVKPGPPIAWTVVGVVADEKVSDIDGKWEPPVVYVTYEQSPTEAQSFVVKGNVEAPALRESIRKAIAGVNSDQVITNMMTLENIKAESTGNERFMSLLLGIFGGTALLLSALGIYGVMSYSIAQRVREIGIRSALGASAGNLQMLILASGLRLAGAGLVVGFVGVCLFTRLMASLLFNIGTQDPIAIAAAAGILSLVALLACYLPARKAIAIDPIIAIRID